MMNNSIKNEAKRLFRFFQDYGAKPFDTEILQPADQLLDLYGEDIRGRAFVTEDVAHGELMLRPDFTVPLAKYHMKQETDQREYVYQGVVFRNQRPGSYRSPEYLQVGYELFGYKNKPATEALLFSRFYEVLKPLGLRPIVGDLGLLIGAINSLSLASSQKAALKRHIWRPEKFRSLLNNWEHDRSEQARVASTEQQIVDNIYDAGPIIGQRSIDEIVENILAKNNEASAPTLTPTEQEAIDQLLNLKCTLGDALQKVYILAENLDGLQNAYSILNERIDAFNQYDSINVDQIWFEASYGRTRLEYYNGFVFGFVSETEEQPVALGGRFDYLTEALGAGRLCPAVGGMIRPELTVKLRD